MSQPIVYLLLFLALLVPVVGAVALRLLFGRISERGGVLAAGAIFGLAVASVLLLARSDVPSLQIGRLTLLLPVSVPAAVQVPLPPPAPPPAPAATTAAVTAAATVATTRTAPATPTTATAAATATQATPTPEPPTPTPEPPTPTPEPPAEEPAQQIYVVEPGDTIRSIAEQFDVSVADLLAANDLAPADADSIRPGQELIIP